MNKIYQRIDWKNYPSSATPLNEDNLNKMDYAIDKLDDRIVTHETTKLNTATGNTLVKNVTFDERTGVFTIEKLSGSKITINTALEKISTNFHFNPTTQKLILTLIDGTTQEIDLSALLTQYEFLESDTITFTIDASGKVKANILNGSITGEKLEPNYLANVTLQANNAKTSADNAKTSEELAYQYAEEAKESASQTAKSDAKNITYDNTESGLSATNVKDALDEVAQGLVSAIATDTTITDSTNAPLVRLKVKGKTEQFTTSGKNLCSSNNFTVTAPASGTPQSNYAYKSINIHNKITSNKTYIFSADIKKLVGSPSEISIVFMNEALSTGTEIKTGTITNNHVEISIPIGNASVYYYLLVYAGKQGSTEGNSIEFSNVMLRESTSSAEYEPYTNGASPNPDYPQDIVGMDNVSVKTTGKNIFGGLALENKIVGVVSGATKNEETGSMQFSGSAITGHILFDSFKANTQYTFIFYGKNLGSLKSLNMCVYYSDGTRELMLFPETDYSNFVFTSEAGKTIKSLEGIYQDGVTILYPEKCGVFEGVITADDFEPYTETLAEIDLTEPLYEGDYIEYRADGTGVLYRKFTNFKPTTIDGVTTGNNLSAYVELTKGYCKSRQTALCNYLTVDETMRTTSFNFGDNAEGNLSNVFFMVVGLTTKEEYQTWLNEHSDLEIVYELATPQEIELTAEQLAQFKNLRTFEPVTNVLCDGETEIQYYKNTPSGVAVGTVHKMANDEKATYDGDGKKIIVVTDSYGVPVREDDGTYGSWVDMLAEKYEVLKIASGGAGFVSYFDNKFLNNLRATTIDDKEAYTDIIVAGGVNDAGDSTKPITAEDISNGIIEFCDYCKENFPNAKIHIACVGGITPRSNIKERCLNLHNVVFQAYSNTDADYDYCTFSESIFYDRSLLINVHPTEEGHIETFKYFNRMLNGQCSFVRNFNSIVKINNTNIGFHGTISNGIAHYTGQRTQIVLGELEIGPAYNFATGVEVGVISDNSVLAVPSRAGYVPYAIMGSLYVARTQPSSLAYAGVGFLYPNEDGTKLLLQITSPDLVGSANNKIKANFYFIPTPTVIAQTTA